MSDLPSIAPRLSVVAPCYNEEASLPTFVARMVAAAQAAAGDSYEIVLVNDGSRDGTWAAIQTAARDLPRIVGVNLARNHGHQLAVTAGLNLLIAREFPHLAPDAMSTHHALWADVDPENVAAAIPPP